MVGKTKIKAILKAFEEIQGALPTAAIEQLIEDIETEILEPIEERLAALAEKDRLTEKQEGRQSALEEEQSNWEDVCDELANFKDYLDEIENLIEQVENIE